MRTPYQSFNAPATMNGGRGQRLARMLQMQGQSQQISNNAGAQTDMQYSPPQNAADMNPAPRQFARMYPRKPKTPGMVNPQGGPDRGSFENG
jgi:hypothetical protein